MASFGEEMARIAMEQEGKPYLRGTSGPVSFDCSGLVRYCAIKAGYTRQLVGLYNEGGAQQLGKYYTTGVMERDLQPGDLVFCKNSASDMYIGHVGIYIGDKNMINAVEGKGVVISNFAGSWYTDKCVSFGRLR